MGQLPTFQPLDHWQKLLTQAGFGGRNQPSGLIKQGNPGVVVTAILDELIADALKESGAVLFLDEQLVNVSYGTKHEVEALYFFFVPLQFQSLYLNI